MYTRGEARMIWGMARKKPITVDYRDPIPNGYAVSDLKEGSIRVEWIKTLEGRIYAIPGRDYVIRGVSGELYPIKINIFNETFEILQSPNQKEPTS